MLRRSRRLQLAAVNAIPDVRATADFDVEVDFTASVAEVNVLAPVDDSSATNPSFVKEAQRSPYWGHWMGAIHEKLNSLVHKDVYEEVSVLLHRRWLLEAAERPLRAQASRLRVLLRVNNKFQALGFRRCETDWSVHVRSHQSL